MSAIVLQVVAAPVLLIGHVGGGGGAQQTNNQLTAGISDTRSRSYSYLRVWLYDFYTIHFRADALTAAAKTIFWDFILCTWTTEAKFLVPSGGPERQPYAIVDYIPQSKTKNFASGHRSSNLK